MWLPLGKTQNKIYPPTSKRWTIGLRTFMESIREPIVLVFWHSALQYIKRLRNLNKITNDLYILYIINVTFKKRELIRGILLFIYRGGEKKVAHQKLNILGMCHGHASSLFHSMF